MAGWQACHPQPLTWRATETGEMGLAAAAARNLQSPKSMSARLGRDPRPRRTSRVPAPLTLTVGPRQTASGRDSEASRPPQPAGVTDPSVPGDCGGGHPKACGLREKENPLLVNRLTFPSQSELHLLPPACPPPSSIPPCAAGSCGYLKGLSKIRVEEIKKEQVGLRARLRTTVPSRQLGARRRLQESGMQNSARAVVMERC